MTKSQAAELFSTDSIESDFFLVAETHQQKKRKREERRKIFGGCVFVYDECDVMGRVCCVVGRCCVDRWIMNGKQVDHPSNNIKNDDDGRYIHE